MNDEKLARKSKVSEATSRLLVFVSIPVAAGIIFKVTILVIPLILNWVLCAFIDGRGSGIDKQKKPTARRHAGYAVLAIQFVLLELLIVAPWVLCVVIAFSVRLQGLALFLIGGGFFAAVLALDLIRKPGGSEKRLVSPSWMLAGAAAIIVVLLLDRIYFFEFTLLLAAAFLAGLFALHILWNSVAIMWSGAMDNLRRVGMWAALAVLWGGLFFTVMNLSATGSFKLCVEDVGFALKPSRRATINSLGFRGEEIKIKKEKDTFRIAVLGDSATYGWLVSERFTYSRALERLLRIRSRGALKRQYDGRKNRQ